MGDQGIAKQEQLEECGKGLCPAVETNGDDDDGDDDCVCLAAPAIQDPMRTSAHHLCRD